VLDLQCSPTENASDSLCLPLIMDSPFRIILDQSDLAVEGFEFAYGPETSASYIQLQRVL